jgi:hypothetical protein
MLCQFVFFYSPSEVVKKTALVQRSAAITSELEQSIRSATFQELRPVLKFSYKPPGGIPLAQSCLEIFLTQSHSGCLD